MSLYRRPDSPFWWSKLCTGGNVVRFSTGERTKVEALSVERTRAAELKRARSQAGRYTLGTLAVKFLNWKEEHAAANGRTSDLTMKMRRRHLKLVGAFFSPEIDPRQIDEAAQEEFRAARMKLVGAGTVCKELSTLRQLMKYAMRVAKIMPEAPLARNPEHHYDGSAWHILDRDQLAAFLRALAATKGQEVLPWALLRANTGMRPTEATLIDWSMLDFRASALDLPGRITKSRKSRTVPLNAGALDALWMMAIRRGPGPAIGRVFHERAHYTAWRSARESLGLDGFRPHDLRHTLASQLHDANVPPAVIRDIFGHQTFDMVNRYAHTFDTSRAEALRGVSVAMPNVTENVPLRGPIVTRTGTEGQSAIGT